ncbi:hypothetical protein SAMN05660909_01394 [Chitinophaga terrae (ex Kim and Jung 2007)]|uniref:Uncharacterized protein n=1 Tax=Chitinophaga terrae (ex Kim and Jung 2007) TaxID=408074 RepID=A0A1H4A1H5_9BACT|nr:hypothetical protein [Chitinophaga terrae (ex Kim and Jung 2007)]MDQ0106099.1 hypothetical protein [Chitinophaga terrae (ex Kim and Jung 2007)]GEP89976.1 hypothetical protein CTE07_16210 [Chitinophaga terrae (ex Kim and Jung 2007)]SEA29372.1 hypothetical protein SAMN05660909_01394 [Chitinophaga terrae (ex Kim and Jung 2007)]
MEQPLALLTEALLKAMLENGFTLFVRQSYPAGRNSNDEHIKEALLVTPYTNIGEANLHFQHIRFDKRKYIYQTHHAEEVEKLYHAARQPAGYKIYIAVIQDSTTAIIQQLLPMIHKYVVQRTKWGETALGRVRAGLLLQYGELYVTLHYVHQEIRVPLSELDNL